ncbi:MAG: hypothetical protein ACK2UR_20645 [Candidatus Promineifilaceae bacterium]|jgi:hypothetical protein
MKPLVYYSRWQGASLRLRGRDSDSVWGQLVSKSTDGQEEARDFRFVLDSAELFIGDEQGVERHYWLDEKGIPLPAES